VATTKKTGERTKRKANAPAEPPGQRSPTEPSGKLTVQEVTPRKLTVGNVTIAVATDPPLLPPFADIVEVHARGHEVSLVFARVPFYVDYETLQAQGGGEVKAIPVCSVTLPEEIARRIGMLIEDTVEVSK
jgi:hypothetical protein